MKLYGSLTSPYVRKLRACAIEQGIDIEFIAEGPSDPAGNVARLNPLGKVPVLERDDGEALFDSPLIVEYLDSVGKTQLIPPVGEARWQAQRWHALSQGVLDAVVTRLMETRRAPEKQDSAVIAKQEGKVAAALRYADKQYRGGEYLLGEALTIADIAWAVALEYIDLRYAHDWRTAHPRLAAWHSTIRDRASLRETRPQ